MGGGDVYDIRVGDTVDVPGGMHGIAKFIGSIAGKSGTFLGVELAKQYAHKGKNDGDVDG
jgi:dynactin complex subunit